MTVLTGIFNFTLQQEYVQSELQEYASQDTRPSDSKSVLEVVAYLTACNQMFERGILGKRVFIRSADCPILDNMDKGFKYFSNWLDVELSKGRSTYFTCTTYIMYQSESELLCNGVHVLLYLKCVEYFVVGIIINQKC